MAPPVRAIPPVGVCVLATATMLIGCAASESSSAEPLQPKATLRQLAVPLGLVMGSAVDMRDFFPVDEQYRQVLAEQYNGVVAGNAMKFANIHPGPADYSFDEADALVAFAEANGMVVHGHTLVWHQSLPEWVTKKPWTRSELLAVLREHIALVVGRYRGQVRSWDVVNEGLDEHGVLRRTVWNEVIGPDYIDSAFVWAHAADASAKLYLNDAAAEGTGLKADSVLALVQALRARGIPIDGVGFECHFSSSKSPAFPNDTIIEASRLRANFARFANAGFDVRVSEIDVKIPDSAPEAALITQAIVYRDALDACLRLGPRCGGFTSWGFTDRESWIPARYPGFGRALPLDADFHAKPAFDSLSARLTRQ